MIALINGLVSNEYPISGCTAHISRQWRGTGTVFTFSMAKSFVYISEHESCLQMCLWKKDGVSYIVRKAKLRNAEVHQENHPHSC